jgi:DNA ligase (NAD+)
MSEGRLRELIEIIERANYHYYGLDNPILTDAEYDSYLQELLAIEKKHPELTTADSPSQRVGGFIASQFPKVRHFEPLLSLDNAFNAEDLREFDRRVRSIAPDAEYVVELKIDGLTVALTYEDGMLIRGATWVTEKLAKKLRPMPRQLGQYHFDYVNTHKFRYFRL